MKITLTLMLCALGVFLGIGVTHAQTQVLPNGAGGLQRVWLRGNNPGVAQRSRWVQHLWLKWYDADIA